MSVERFMKVYTTVPLKLRDEVILELDNTPITWNIAYQEIKNNTKKGEKILKYLIKFDII